jgi:CRP/FNR family transcriptional regulator, nitrogen oxide reductase regulator
VTETAARLDSPGDDRAKEKERAVKSALFAGIDGSMLEAVLAAAVRRSVPARTVLFRQGAPAEYLYLLITGHMKVGHVDAAGNPLTVRFMRPGYFIGCVAVFRRVPYPATATAVADSVVLSWSTAKVAGFFEQCPRIASNAIEMVGSRTEEMLHRLSEMATERVESRVAKTLLRLAEGAAAKTTVEIGFALSRQDIAEMAGTDLYNVSRVLSRWKRQGIVETSRQRIVICALSVLQKFAGEPD